MSSPQVLTDRIRHAAAARPAGTITFIAGDVASPVPWSELVDDAMAFGAAMQARGIGRGDHVAILGPTGRHLVTAIVGTWFAGGTAVVLPLPMRLSSIDEFVRQTRDRVRRADARLLLIDPLMADFVTAEDGDPPMVGLDVLASESQTLGRAALVDPCTRPDDLAILQFTSGSTSDPKGVMLPHRAICSNLDAIAVATHLDPHDDVLVSWLPLYHDMGLIGKLCLTVTTATDLVLAAPQDFLASPRRWVEWMSQYGGTATAAPNFAYALAARAMRRLDGLDLGRWRVALNGAEPVDPATIADFLDAGARHGLRPSAMFPAFGMAEVSIAGAFPPPGRGLVVDAVDRTVLEAERLAVPVDHDADGARHLARLGRPVQGMEMRICDPDTGRVLGEREAGELEVRGTSLTTGYYRNDAANAAAFRPDGWFRTGDLAYLVDGELVICGRIKDLIIIGGRNVFPEDIERSVADVDGVRRGNVIAFGVEGRRSEKVVVVAEVRDAEADDLPDRVAAAAREAVGAAVSDVVLVGAGTLPKTSSGKLQRSLCKRRYLDGVLEAVCA